MVDRLIISRVAALAAAWLLLCGSLLAQKVVETTGEGSSRQSAIHKALTQALEMVNGVEIQSNATVSEFFSAVDTEEGSTQESRVDSMDAIRTQTDGYIRNYEVLSEKEVEDGWAVRLKVAVLVYDPSNPRPGQRPTLAILNAILQDGGILEIPGEDGSRHLEDLSTGLGQKIQELGVFNLVEREYLDAILEEQGLIRDGMLAPAEQAKLGNLLGADYILQVALSELSVVKDPEELNPTRGRIQAALRITGGATGQQIAIRTFEREAIGRDLKELSGGGSSASYPSSLAALPIPEWGEWIEDSLGPVRLLGFKEWKRRGKSSWGFAIDNSSSLVAAGQVYDLFVQERIMSNGVQFWSDCEEVCSVQISDSSSKNAQAQLHLLEGETLSEMQDWLKKSEAAFRERAGNPMYRYILRRRSQ